MSSRRSSHSEAAPAIGGRARAGSGSSNRSGTGTSTSSKPTSANAAASNVSCHFRYTGCYLLVIISDGCDMLRQQQLCQDLQLKSDAIATAKSNGTETVEAAPPPDLVNTLDSLDAEWNRKFIEHTTQQVAKGQFCHFNFYFTTHSANWY